MSPRASSPSDTMIRLASGPAPLFDPITQAFLRNSQAELTARGGPSALVDWACLEEPWLYRFTFLTRGLEGTVGSLRPVAEQTVAVRFFPDYLRRVDRFAMLALVTPADLFHPNIRPPGICLAVHPGQSLVSLVENLHDLFRWKLRNLNERDALNAEACAWGRTHLAELPLDARSLWGRASRLSVQWEPTT